MQKFLQRAISTSRVEFRLAKRDWDNTPKWLKWLHYFACGVSIIATILIGMGVI